MAKFYWIGSTLTTSSKLSSFTWNNKENWREEYIPTGTALVKQVKTASTTIPGNKSGTRDEVYIGYPLVDQNNNKLNVRSPLLFGGVTGNITPDSATGGITWEMGLTGAVDFYIAGGTFFQQGYNFSVIGGGITGGGQGYWNSFEEFKNWACNYYNITNTNDINNIFSSTQINTNPNLNQLKIKPAKVIEDAIAPSASPLLVSMQIPRTWLPGTTLAATEYIRKGQNIKTVLQNSVVNKITNIASRVAQTDPTTGDILAPVSVGNYLTVNNCIVHRYEGYYEDNVNIKSNCRITSAQIFSPVAPASNPTNYFANNLFTVKLAGRYGAYYTSSALGLTGVGPTDGQITLDDTRKPEFGQTYQPQYRVIIGEANVLTGSTASYVKVLNSTNNTISFTGKCIIETFNADNTYIGYKSDLAQYSTDTVNVVYLNMRNRSSLDFTVTPQFDRWFFGKLPTGQTLVQGGIFAMGDGNKIYGSPGVALYNDVLLASADIGTRNNGGKPTPTEILTNISATSPQQTTNLA